MTTNDGLYDEDLAHHPTETQLQAFALGETPSYVADLESHVAGCLLCRVRIGRLKIADREAPNPSFLATLTAESPRLEPYILDALRRPESSIDNTPIQSGQLWRARNRDENAKGSVAVLVWVRKVFESTAAVLPVFLDTDLADSETLIIAAERTPLQTELALFSNIDGEIPLSNLATLIGPLDIDKDVADLRIASRNATAPPEHLAVGSPIVRNDDQRLEFRQIISELLASLYVEPGLQHDDDADVHDLLSEIRELSYYCSGLRVEPLPFEEMIYLDDRHTLHPVAAIHHLATCVVVTAVFGPDPTAQLTHAQLPHACAFVQHRFDQADCVAACAVRPGWPAVLLTSMDMERAIEVPSGQIHDASVYGRPLEIAVALLKYFEGASNRWDDTSSVRFDGVSDSLRSAEALSASIALSAIENVRQKGHRATISAKKQGYSRLTPDAAQAISELIRDVLAGTDPTQALDDLLGEST